MLEDGVHIGVDSGFLFSGLFVDLIGKTYGKKLNFEVMRDCEVKLKICKYLEVMLRIYIQFTFLNFF